MQIYYSSNNDLRERILVVEPFNVISKHITIISSYTLADLVFNLLKFTGDALTKVKAGLQETWDGIKDGVEYVTNLALTGITLSLVTLINALITTTFQTTAVVTDFSQITTATGNQLSFMDFQLDISVVPQDQNIIITANELIKVLSIASIFTETLGLGATTAYHVIEQTLVTGIIGWVSLILGTLLTIGMLTIAAGLALLVISLVSTLVHYYTLFYETIHQYNILTNANDKHEYATIIGQFHEVLTAIYLGFVSLVVIIDSLPIVITEIVMKDIAGLISSVAGILLSTLKVGFITNPNTFLPQNLIQLFYEYIALLGIVLIFTSMFPSLFGILLIIYALLGVSSGGLAFWMELK